jgi:murein hydrolase activator
VYRTLQSRATFSIAAFLVLAAFNFNYIEIAIAKDDSDSKKLQLLKNEISHLQLQLRRADDKRDKLTTKLRETELKTTEIHRALKTLNRQINSLNKELGELSQRQKKLELRKNRQAQLVGKELSAAYQLGQQESLKMFFNLESPDKISRMLKYYEYLVEARTEIISNYKRTLEELADIEIDIYASRKTLEENQARLSKSSRELDEQLRDRRGLLTKINQQLSNDNGRLEKLKLERSQLEKILAKLKENIQQLSIPNEMPFIKQRGNLPWPVQGRIRNRFGTNRNANLKWSGWLLDAKQSSSVKAIHYGRVIFSDYLRGHGLILIIDHGGGYLSLYAHNQILLKETGDWVTSGENIAQVGNTGGLEKSALYFEIRHQGKAVDPKTWLKSKA